LKDRYSAGLGGGGVVIVLIADRADLWGAVRPGGDGGGRSDVVSRRCCRRYVGNGGRET